MKHYGLIGKTLIHSFSQAYFTEKFARETIDADYALLELDDISKFPMLVSQGEWSGFNVTIPYKEAIMPFLDHIDPTAKSIGAINCITINRHQGNPILSGHNTDIYGFKASLLPLLKPQHTKALILGTGGASKAVKFVLEELNITYTCVSRTASRHVISYSSLNDTIINEHKIIINTTPLGTYPNITEAPLIPYSSITPEHLLYDLVYNPKTTKFLMLGDQQGAHIKNGLEMLYLQAEEAYRLFTK